MFDSMRILRMTREVIDLTVYLIIACHVVLKQVWIDDRYRTINIPTLLAAVLCPRSTPLILYRTTAPVAGISV